MAKHKSYVVWKGRKTGVFDTWEECKTQVLGFEGASYKAFENRALAEEAFKSGKQKSVAGAKKFSPPPSITRKPKWESISVDAAWNTDTGVAEYRGVDTKTKKVLFEMGPFTDGTNNIVEFIAIVHALGYCKKHNLAIPIYSDSMTALSWLRKKKTKSLHSRNERNKELFELFDRAEKWIRENDYPNAVLKWETTAWGENPADYGRK